MLNTHFGSIKKIKNTHKFFASIFSTDIRKMKEKNENFNNEIP